MTPKMSHNETYRISTLLLLLVRIPVLAAKHPSADGPSYEDSFQQKVAFTLVAFLSYHISVNPPPDNYKYHGFLQFEPMNAHNLIKS